MSDEDDGGGEQGRANQEDRSPAAMLSIGNPNHRSTSCNSRTGAIGAVGVER